MGTKADPGEHDCYAKAYDDEPMFVLLARDPLAPALVREWAARRRRTRDVVDPKAEEALELAREMEDWVREQIVLAREEVDPA